ncbi:hypothetical protein HPB52_007151 [Rhipicephalus sanguineus]|uniref:CCHC-type domain-containing protein n=1 Tax=Rhipicephalus sanguineus TaxID=34632 RepID=A0A9D4PHI5_RHISA|nr:hypothetical protein HPB52_007151 [Rhipicephalus sanguineus]
MASHLTVPVRENCFLFNAPDGDVSVDDLIDAIELTAGDDSVLVLQHRGGSKFLVCTRNANQAIKLIVAEGFRLNHEKVAVEAVGPPVTYVNVYRLPAYLPDDVLTNALQQYAKVRGVSFATVPSRQNKLNGVRVVKMEMCKPVPNFTTIQGHRVMCEYRGMRRVCARCGEDGHMATACTNPYCKRCGVFGHDTEGCSEECKRCGGRHGTWECFRRRSYVAAACGFPPASETALARDQSSGQASPTGSMGMSGLHVLKPRPAPSTPRKAPDYWDGDKTTENDPMSAATSPSVPRADQRACAEDSASATSDSDITAISPSDASSAKPSPNSSLAPHSSSDEQEVPTTGANLDGVESTSPLANDESNASASHGRGHASNLDEAPIVSSGRYALPPPPPRPLLRPPSDRPRPKPSGACDQQDGEHGFDREHIAART